MKKFLSVLLVGLLCVALLAACGEKPAEPVASEEPAPENKVVESLVGMFYNQGECGVGYLPAGNTYNTNYDYTIADQLAAILDGTDKVPFYAYNTDGKVFFDRFAKDALINEIDLASDAGVDFVVYKYYAGIGKDAGATEQTNLTLMNNQLKLHATIFSQPVGFKRAVNYTTMIDGDFDASKDAKFLVNEYMLQRGFLTAADGRPVVFIEWNNNVAAQIDSINKKFGNAVKNGADETKKNSVETIYDVSIQTAYFVAVNAPDYATASTAGCEAVINYAPNNIGGTYADFTSKLEASWEGENVIPVASVGYDESLLEGKEIKIDGMLKYYDDDAPSTRYNRTGSSSDKVAKATADEFAAHVQKAVETTNKPENFKAAMVYSWDDFVGGANLCPTKTSTENEFEYSYLKAMRKYFFGTEAGMTEVKGN